MRGWQTSDISKLGARGLKVNVALLPKNRVIQKRENLKIISLPVLLAKVQNVFNKFIRNRDKDKGCISCKSGKVQQASHFFSVGQFSALRFNEDNCWGSCVHCNYFLSGNLLPYREALLKRIGEERLYLLERSAKLNRVKKWSRFELEIIYRMYKEKSNETIQSITQ